MNEKHIELIDRAWDVDSGFFFLLRDRNFSLSKGNEVLNALRGINIDNESEKISRETVRLIWHIPLFMNWQKENMESVLNEADYTLLYNLTEELQSEVMRLLGLP